MTEYEPKMKLENNSTAVAASTLKQQLINSANQVIPNTVGRTLRRELYEDGTIPDPTSSPIFDHTLSERGFNNF